MGKALEEMLKIAPIIRREKQSVRDLLVRTAMTMENRDNVDWFKAKVPYIQKINEHISEKGGIADICFLVTERSSLADIAATYISGYKKPAVRADSYDIELDEYRDYEDVYADIQEYMQDKECYEVDFSKRYEGNNGVDSGYLPYILDIGSYDKVLFTGINGVTDIDDKLDTLLSCKAKNKFIKISKEQIKEPWVVDIQMNYETDIFYMDDDFKEYHEKVISTILKTCNMKLSEDLNETYLLDRIKRAINEDVNEKMIAWVLDRAFDRCPGNVLEKEHFAKLGMGEKDSMQILLNMTGLGDLKQKAREYQAIAIEKSRNKALGNLHTNMIFYGNPGTGKTSCARILAGILCEAGVGSPKFAVCTRSDLIGKYVGHTAPRVAKKFEEARGGVMFVDEAGFFLNRKSGGYIDEAIKEFVRYMELYPDVTVIFAMYGREMEDFFKLDQGLTSRIAETVYFADYTVEELWDIFGKMLGKGGYKVSGRCKAKFISYMEERMKQDDFGNAREARKLSESCLKALSVRNLSHKADDTINLQDMDYAIERISVKGINEARQPIGFIANVER